MEQCPENLKKLAVISAMFEVTQDPLMSHGTLRDAAQCDISASTSCDSDCQAAK